MLRRLGVNGPFIEGVAAGGAVGFVGLDLIKELFDVFGFVLEQVHGQIL